MPAPAEEDMRPTIERVEPTPDPVTAKLLHHRETSASVDTAGDEDVQGAPDKEAPGPGG